MMMKKMKIEIINRKSSLMVNLLLEIIIFEKDYFDNKIWLNYARIFMLFILNEKLG
jgi:hypothetical protein